MCTGEELTDLALDVFREMHVFHGCVGDIHLLDESLTLSVKCLQDNCDSTKHIGIEKCTKNQNTGAHEVLDLGLWVNIIAAKCKDRGVEDD